MSGSVLSLLYGLVFVSTPGCGNGAGRQVYICSLFCLVQLVKSGQVCAPFVLTADFCPLHHLEAKQVFLIELFYCCVLSSTPFRG